MPRWNALDYSMSSSEQEKWAQELISKLTLKGNERILDIGCGDGKVTAAMARMLPKGSVLGIDSSKEMIRFAQRSFPARRFPNLDFKEGDARKLSFTGEFDIVFSNATLHWVINHLPVLKGIKRSLKPSGIALLQMGGRGNAKAVVDIVDAITSGVKWDKYFQDFAFPYGFYGPEEYYEWVKLSELRARRIELIEKDMVLKGKDGLHAWIRTTWLLYTERVPEELRFEFIDDIVETYIRYSPLDKEGMVHVQMVRLEVEAEGVQLYD
ncbi:MAG: methyltransferase domain-containing protein [Chloroflexota bacterium]|nr:methyltransferase domain-containing protein [Chloroflexota bacterium]